MAAEIFHIIKTQMENTKNEEALKKLSHILNEVKEAENKGWLPHGIPQQTIYSEKYIEAEKRIQTAANKLEESMPTATSLWLFQKSFWAAKFEQIGKPSPFIESLYIDKAELNKLLQSNHTVFYVPGSEKINSRDMANMFPNLISPEVNNFFQNVKNKPRDGGWYSMQSGKKPRYINGTQDELTKWVKREGLQVPSILDYAAFSETMWHTKHEKPDIDTWCWLPNSTYKGEMIAVTSFDDGHLAAFALLDPYKDPRFGIRAMRKIPQRVEKKVAPNNIYLRSL